MRTMLSAIILAGGVGLTGATNALASPIGSGVPSADVFESVVVKTDHRRGRYCERLRRACVYKEDAARSAKGIAAAIVASAADVGTSAQVAVGRLRFAGDVHFSLVPVADVGAPRVSNRLGHGRKVYP